MTRVIKVGGRAQSNPTLAMAVAEAWDAVTGMIMVHGGGDEVSALQSTMGVTAQFVDGRRVTSAQDIEFVRMALSGSANKRLVAALVREGVRAVGLSGEDASLIAATPVDAPRLGHVGAPKRINTSLLEHLIDGGYLPVNGDDAAAAIAVASEASELTLVSDVPGVLVDGALADTITAAEARALLHDGRASGGMRAKLAAALIAVDEGVKIVRITDIAGITDLECGTRVLKETE